MACPAPVRYSRGMTAAPAPPRTISVLFATDLNYLQHAVACIASLLANNPTTDFEVLLVGTQDLTPSIARIRRSFEGQPRLSLRIEKFAIPAGFAYPSHHRFTVETYIRFWIGELFPGAHRALYLDPDIITTAPITELWSTDLGGKTLAAVPIPGSTRPAVHGFPPGSKYFNAGVMADRPRPVARPRLPRRLPGLPRRAPRGRDRRRPGHPEYLSPHRLGSAAVLLEHDQSVLFPLARPATHPGRARRRAPRCPRHSFQWRFKALELFQPPSAPGRILEIPSHDRLARFPPGRSHASERRSQSAFDDHSGTGEAAAEKIIR